MDYSYKCAIHRTTICRAQSLRSNFIAHLNHLSTKQVRAGTMQGSVSGLTYSGPEMGFPGMEVRNRTTQTFEITIRRSKSKEGQSTTELVS